MSIKQTRNYDFVPRWASNGREKSDFNEFSFWAHESLRNGKKKIQAFDLSILMSELEVSPEEHRREKLGCKEFSFGSHEPLINGKKKSQDLESLYSDVRARS